MFARSPITFADRIMRPILLLLLLALAQCGFGQHLTFMEWEQESFKDMRLMPKYGNRHKNPKMVASDSAFVAQTLAAIPDRRKASNALVDHGFELLRTGDMKAAMFRFNQAYLVEPDNAEIYRGYGAFFVALDRSTEAAVNFQAGLALDSTNSRLMTDMAAVFLGEYYDQKASDTARADQFLHGATTLLEHAVKYDPNSTEAAFRLAVCYFQKGDCEQAWRLYDQCEALGGKDLMGTFTGELERKCPR